MSVDGRVVEAVEVSARVGSSTVDSSTTAPFVVTSVGTNVGISVTRSCNVRLALLWSLEMSATGSSVPFFESVGRAVELCSLSLVDSGSKVVISGGKVKASGIQLVSFRSSSSLGSS